MRLTDTHCHLDLEHFDADRLEVIERAQAAGITRILIPGLDVPSSQRVVDLAGSHPILFAAVGVHPTEALSWSGTAKDDLRSLAQDDSFAKVVAIGEVGLDYYWDAAPHDVQQSVLGAQLDLAAKLSLPVVIHLREKGDAEHGQCAEDLLAMLSEWVTELRRVRNPLAKCPGVLHSFSGSLETAQKALDLGFYVGVTGPVTYRNADARREIVSSIPLERLLVETDAPYLAPALQRGKRNEPAFVQHIADKIAGLHHVAPEEAADVTSANAGRLFGWERPR